MSIVIHQDEYSQTLVLSCEALGHVGKLQTATITDLTTTIQQAAVRRDESAHTICLDDNAMRALVAAWAKQQGLMLVPAAADWDDIAVEGPAWPARNEAQA